MIFFHHLQAIFIISFVIPSLSLSISTFYLLLQFLFTIAWHHTPRYLFFVIIIKKMNKNSRVRVSPVVQDLKDISIKARGIIVVQPHTKSSIIEVKPQQKILYHCYKRYKSFIFAFDAVYDKNEFYSQKVEYSSAVEAVTKGYNYCLLCSGSKSAFLGEFCEGTTSKEGFFYSILSSVFNQFVKKQIMQMKVNFFAINQDLILDLISFQAVETREGNGEIAFHNAEGSEILSLYQLYNSIKNFYEARKNKLPESYFVIHCQLRNQNSSGKKILLVQIPNDCGKSQNSENTWNSNSLMVLNQCISGLSNRLNSKGKQFHGPFRNSKITKILKPFFLQNTKLDAVGIISPEQSEATYQTLGFIRNTAKIRIPCSDAGQNAYKFLYEKVLLQNEEMKKEKSSPKKKDKIKEIEDVGREESNLKKQLKKLRRNLKILEEESIINYKSVMYDNPEDVSRQKELEMEQYDSFSQKQKKIMKKIEDVQKKRLQTLANTNTKTQKLQIMKKFYTLSIQNQQEELRQQEAQILENKRIYQKKLKAIEDELKRKPSQMIGYKVHEQSIKHRSESLKQSVVKQKKLPQIMSYKHHRHRTLVKEKVRKGRVELKQFFQNNIQKYREY